jgi:hypothetical protein
MKKLQSCIGLGAMLAVVASTSSAGALSVPYNQFVSGHGFHAYNAAEAVNIDYNYYGAYSVNMTGTYTYLIASMPHVNSMVNYGVSVNGRGEEAILTLISYQGTYLMAAVSTNVAKSYTQNNNSMWEGSLRLTAAQSTNNGQYALLARIRANGAGMVCGAVTYEGY